MAIVQPQNEGFIDIIREKIMYYIVIITHLGLSTSRHVLPNISKLNKKFLKLSYHFSGFFLQ